MYRLTDIWGRSCGRGRHLRMAPSRQKANKATHELGVSRKKQIQYKHLPVQCKYKKQTKLGDILSQNCRPFAGTVHGLLQ